MYSKKEKAPGVLINTGCCSASLIIRAAPCRWSQMRCLVTRVILHLAVYDFDNWSSTHNKFGPWINTLT